MVLGVVAAYRQSGMVLSVRAAFGKRRRLLSVPASGKSSMGLGFVGRLLLLRLPAPGQTGRPFFRMTTSSGRCTLCMTAAGKSCRWLMATAVFASLQPFFDQSFEAARTR